MTTEERLTRLETHVNELYRLLGLGPPDPPRPAVQTTGQAAIDAEMKKSWEKIESWYDGTHPWLQAQQDHIEEAQAAKEAQQDHIEEAQAAKEAQPGHTGLGPAQEAERRLADLESLRSRLP